ncbi:MAG: Fe(3+) dicitrate ABC transporter ATP-binding protein FecE [Burkholderiaceae bacterium]
MTVLEARAVTAGHGGRPAIVGASAEFARGWTAIVGPNGAGKSTLLRALAGLLRPTAGDVLLDGQPLARLAPRQRARAIAWLPQLAEASGELTVRETVALGRLPRLGVFGAPTAADEAAVQAAMQRTECAAWAERRLGELAGGERQRALLARALATEALVLLLDEPTQHLDPPHQVGLAKLARSLGATHTVVTVMHDLALALAADRVLLLADGRIRLYADADDPALHRALERCFDDAVRIEARNGHHVVMPALQ